MVVFEGIKSLWAKLGTIELTWDITLHMRTKGKLGWAVPLHTTGVCCFFIIYVAHSGNLLNMIASNSNTAHIEEDMPWHGSSISTNDLGGDNTVVSNYE